MKVQPGHERTERPLCVTHVICRNNQAVRKAEVIKFSWMTNTSTAIVQMDRSFLSLMKAVLTFVGKFELQYVVSFAKAHIRDIFEIMMPS